MWSLKIYTVVLTSFVMLRDDRMPVWIARQMYIRVGDMKRVVKDCLCRKACNLKLVNCFISETINCSI